MKGSKILSTIVAISIILSAIMVLNYATDFKLVGKVSATTATLTKDGSEGAWALLTPGEVITLDVTDKSLNATESYSVKVWNRTAWADCKEISNTQKADKFGDIAVSFYVPGRAELGFNPLINSGDTTNDLSSGQYNVSLFDKYGTQVTGVNETITIGNYYYLKFFTSNGTEIDSLIYNKSYSQLKIQVYNWTGTTLSPLDSDDGEYLDYRVYKPDGVFHDERINDVNGYWAALSISRANNNHGGGVGCLENDFWINVTNNDYRTQYTNFTLPTKLDYSITTPTSAEWGDTITVTGYLRDGQGDEIALYDVALYSPVNGGYYQVDSDDTSDDGYFSLSCPTGSGTGKNDYASAGTWYVGTIETGAYRTNETDILNIDDFIHYKSFSVSAVDDVIVSVVNTDDLISGFTQTINITVKNHTKMKEYEYRDMQIHVTGLTGWWNGIEYDADDIVLIADACNITKYTDTYAWYEFDYRFNQTGKATIWVSWKGNLTSIAKTDYLNGVTSYYSKQYDNKDGPDTDTAVDLMANITGYTTISVESPEDINLVIPSMVDAVAVTEIVAGEKYKNSTSTFTLYVYGDDEDTSINATINITGCGLDITVNGTDVAGENEYLTARGNGWYTIKIAPKYGGTLTITATNGTDSTSKDYTIDGLTGSASTSKGDDLEISVETPETITVTVDDSPRADVFITMFDKTWTTSTAINSTTGDKTAGNGLNGVYEFTPDDDTFDNVGYLVVVAEDGGTYMYEIIEIAPIHDITLTCITPSEGNQTLTVGLEQDIIIEVTDPNGDAVTDIDPDYAIGKLYDVENNLKQTVTFEEGDEDGYWQITGTDSVMWYAGELRIEFNNNTDLNEHDGTLTLNVDYATITYSPDTLIAGIELENISIEVLAVDANGNALPEDTTLYINIANMSGAADITVADTDVTNFKIDEDGKGEFEVSWVGDKEGYINVTLLDCYTAGNTTSGKIDITFPVFTINPSTIYIGRSNIVTIIAEDGGGVAIEGINLTLLGNSITQPSPVKTDADGKVILEVEPTASGIANVTIARNVRYVGGVLNWTDAVVTDSYVTITSIKELTITVSKSPVFQGETLTVTVESGGVAVRDVDVEFMSLTGKTDASGEVDFTVPDPGVDFASVDITATKDGYSTETKGITVIKKYTISIVTPDEICAGESFTVTIIAKGQPLAGATVTLDGTTVKTSGGDGKVTFTAGAEGTTHTITATYESYTAGSATTVAVAKCTPGFELLTLIVAIGVAFILLRRRKHN